MDSLLPDVKHALAHDLALEREFHNIPAWGWEETAPYGDFTHGYPIGHSEPGPALLPIEVGTRVQFPNLDDTYHNIFSYSPVKRFDLGRYRPEERPIPSVMFDRPGLVTLRCDIHEHMRGLILVLNTPYFVMSDTAGRFRLDKLPAGRYTLKAWIDSRTTREKSIDLKDGQTLHVDLP